MLVSGMFALPDPVLEAVLEIGPNEKGVGHNEDTGAVPGCSLGCCCCCCCCSLATFS